MKFKVGDQTDSYLIATISHEYMRTKESFELFAENETYRLKTGNESKQLKIRSYNFYSDFLAHLYEFYLGCFQRDLCDLKEIKFDRCDKYMVAEAQRIFNAVADQIKLGIAPTWENHISHYQVTIPQEFGMHFRFIRNRRNHISIKRASGESITLTDFYRRYHFFVHKMYSYPAHSWGVKDVMAYDFKDIESFTTAINPERF